MSEDGFPGESSCRRWSEGQVEGFWKRQNDFCALAGPGQCVMGESRCFC